MKTPCLLFLVLVLAGCSTTPHSTASAKVSPAKAQAVANTYFHHELISESAEGSTGFLTLVPGE